MSQAERTKQLYEPDGLHMDKLFQLIRQHNNGVRDDGAFTAEMDTELTGNAFASALEGAGQIQVEGLTDDLHDGVTLRAGIYPAVLHEALFRAVVEEQNKRVLGFQAVQTAALADIGVDDAEVVGAGLTPPSEIVALGYEPEGTPLPDFIFPNQSGISGRLLQRLVEQHNALADGWATLAALIEGDILYVGAVTPDGENTGDGTLSIVSLGPDAIAEAITVTADDSDPAEWAISGGTSEAIGTAITGTLFESDHFNLLIEAGATPFANLDEFTFTVAAISETGDYAGEVTEQAIAERTWPVTTGPVIPAALA